jgi:hypothetical protein
MFRNETMKGFLEGFTDDFLAIEKTQPVDRVGRLGNDGKESE